MTRNDDDRINEILWMLDGMSTGGTEGEPGTVSRDNADAADHEQRKRIKRRAGNVLYIDFRPARRGRRSI